MDNLQDDENKSVRLFLASSLFRYEPTGYASCAPLPNASRNPSILCHDGNTNQSTHLHQAIKNNDYALAQSLIMHKLDLNATDQEGNTPLHIAARVGRRKFVHLLLTHHANVHSINHAGRTVLHEAFFTFRKKNRVVPLLITKGAPIDQLDYYERSSVLHHAARSGDEDAVTTLLAHKDVAPLINLPNVYGETPLHRAARSGNPKVVEMLLQVGGHHAARNYRGETPLQSTLSFGKPVIPSLLPLLKTLFLENPSAPKPPFIVQHTMFSSLWDEWLTSYSTFHRQLNLSATRICHLNHETDSTTIHEHIATTNLPFCTKSKQVADNHSTTDSSAEKLTAHCRMGP